MVSEGPVWYWCSVRLSCPIEHVTDALVQHWGQFPDVRSCPLTRSFNAYRGIQSRNQHRASTALLWDGRDLEEAVKSPASTLAEWMDEAVTELRNIGRRADLQSEMPSLKQLNTFSILYLGSWHCVYIYEQKTKLTNTKMLPSIGQHLSNNDIWGIYALNCILSMETVLPRNFYFTQTLSFTAYSFLSLYSSQNTPLP